MITERIDGLGDFEFYKGYFIGRIDAGVNAGPEFVDALSDLIKKHLPGQSIVYISDRVHSYSFDPVATMDLISRNNICYAGVVIHNPKQKKYYSFEESFIEGISMCCFSSLDEAVIWAQQKSQEIT